MNLSVHFITSIILTAILSPWWGYQSLIVIVGGFLIDVDHYLAYIIERKDMNLVKAYKFNRYEKTSVNGFINVFHTIEFWVVCAIFSFYVEIMVMFVMGLILHMLLDIISCYINHCLLFKRWSLIATMISGFDNVNNSKSH
ncbi:hypothetical protein HYX11_03160 [Candidatus Woesearchaeota archaeon]|nr:hypothetical protein [Candidatus Woesearchaeota archaeon]